MPCASGTDLDVALGVVTDFTKHHPYTPAGTLRPRNRGELVRAILTAEAAGKKAKAQGANFSLSSAQVSDGFVIDALRLDRHLSLPVPDTTGSLASDRLRAAGGELAKLVRPGVSLGGKFLVHVEAGIRLKQLIEDLDGLGLALPTMGSRGALSLAGALATGTHGSDIDRPPLGDFVRAIHLVGPGGQEWWIEPSFGVVRAPDSSNHPDWCPETKIVRDDDFFHAALVSVGRFGVIYSLVLEVEPQYWLHDKIEKRKWTAVREQLGSCAQSSSYDVPGVFLRSNGDRVRYYAVDLELAKQEHCWVGRRTVTDNHEDLGLGDAGGSTSFLCDDPKGLGAAVSFMKPLFLALEGQALAIPFAGLVWAPRIIAFWIELQDTAHDSDTVGDFMARAFAKLAALPVSEVGPFFHVEIRAILRDVVELMFSGEMTPERRGRSGRILDTHNYKSAHCLNG
ncbi:MAG TPA: FAD-binding protein, partial [Kofleriaceae bacterium]